GAARGTTRWVIDVADQLSLFRQLFPARSMACDDMGHFMRHHRGDLGAVIGESEQSPGYVKLAAGERERIDGRRIKDGDLGGEVRPVRCRTELGDDAGQLGVELGIFVDAAVSRKDALMLAYARARIRALREIGQENLPAARHGGTRPGSKRERQRPGSAG